MLPPDGLDGVDWSALTHAYGDADDVPELIRALYSEDGETVDEAVYELFGNIVHQGTVFEAAVAAVPLIKELIRRGSNTAVLARFVGSGGHRDAELFDLLRHAAASDNDVFSTAATVALARLSGDVEPALRLLARRLSGEGLGQSAWWLDEAARLGPQGAPLLPTIEELCFSTEDWTRMAAAEAQWRIGGDPSRAVPVLAAIAGPSPVGVRALQALAAIGTAPDELRPRLRDWAVSARRVMTTGWSRQPPHPDIEFRAVCRRLLA